MSKPTPPSGRGETPASQIVISSRVRLARNLRDMAFPGWAKKPERIAILEQVKPAVEALPEMKEARSSFMQDLPALEKQWLVEQHLISREHAAKSIGSAVVISERQAISIMINEEDHLRMQALKPGLHLKSTHAMIDKVDSALETELAFAFHPELGYLTACPTNVGTGMRASAMLHLPGLMLCELINSVINSVNKIGLAVRGLYGEGTEAMGNLFQVSNQMTLGQSEEEILAQLQKVIDNLIGHEHNARQKLLEEKPGMLLDQIGRAYGILSHAHSISTKEALNLLSCIRLGIDLGLFDTVGREPVDALIMETQPAHLQKITQRKLGVEERDEMRAQIIRHRLKSMPGPDIGNLRVGGSETGGPTPETDE